MHPEGCDRHLLRRYELEATIARNKAARLSAPEAGGRVPRPMTGCCPAYGQVAAPFMNMQVPVVQVRMATDPVPQQVSPVPPQGWQFVPPPVAAAHWNPVLQVAAPPPVAAQHLWPAAPHGSHLGEVPASVVTSAQAKPVLQVPPAPPQHTAPDAPQAAHIPPAPPAVAPTHSAPD